MIVKRYSVIFPDKVESSGCQVSLISYSDVACLEKKSTIASGKLLVFENPVRKCCYLLRYIHNQGFALSVPTSSHLPRLRQTQPRLLHGFPHAQPAGFPQRIARQCVLQDL